MRSDSLSRQVRWAWGTKPSAVSAYTPGPASPAKAGLVEGVGRVEDGLRSSFLLTRASITAWGTPLPSKATVPSREVSISIFLAMEMASLGLELEEVLPREKRSWDSSRTNG
jgi:hypothetical protein